MNTLYQTSYGLSSNLDFFVHIEYFVALVLILGTSLRRVYATQPVEPFDYLCRHRAS